MKKLVLIAVATLGMSMSASTLAEPGDPVRGKELSSPCVACHQADGNSVVPAWPKIAGKDEAYLLKQLQDYKAGRRSHALMNPQVAVLEEEDLPHLAAYFASQTATPGRTSASAEKLALGRQIYFGGNAASGVAACVACHGPTGKGNPAAVFPSVAAQHGVYTLDQLQQFRDGLRANDPARMMRNVAGRMTDEEMSAVAEFIATLPPR
ncbi:Cytochrome c553 [Ectothiorhodospira magna]|uniref:Cytochrome c553 n=1 Tax=Ectothiorhodospira magna TaxID=867345 RepID=A0A1H9D7Q1_9GAMM|nr:c-type cytochrome [Ectothiorhodospira magna]SEQ09522.1 Cytochrome c553 [Ectothiorhodospira magna]